MPMLPLRNGSKVFVRVLGKGEPVLLLHGFALDSKQWLPLIAGYLHRFQFILPDCRGHGQSPTGDFKRTNALDQLADDLEDILQALQIKRCLLAAYSMGAVVGLHFALRWGDQKILRYLHIEASPCFKNNETWAYGFNPELREQAIQLVELWDHAGLDGEALAAAYPKLILELAGQAFPQAWLRSLLKTIPQQIIRPLLPDPLFTKEMFSFLLQQGFDFRSQINELKLPGLVLSGGQSKFFPWQGLEWLQKNWRSSEFILFPASGHGLMYSEPLKFNRAFACFLANDLANAAKTPSPKRWISIKGAQ